MEPIISVRNVTKVIGQKKILNKISMDINKGEIVGLIGENGAGKTTLMKTILGLTNYNSGSITGKYIKSNHTGALIENPALYPFLTGYENLKLFNEGDNSSINQIVNELKMNDYINEKCKKYSLGMKQKMGIAMAFLNNPSLIILDEPMNGLDPKSIKEVRELIIKNASNGVSFLISSHILGELTKVADLLIIINKGIKVKELSTRDIDNKQEDLENILLDIIEREDS